MSTPRDNSTTNISVSQQNLASTIASSIASTVPPQPPTLVEDIHEGEHKNGEGNANGGIDRGVGGGEGIGEGGAGSNGIKYLKKGNAPCWQHFDRVEINGKVKAICLYCKKNLAAYSGNGTKALIEHHKRCPRRKVADSSQKVLTQSFITGEGKKKLEAYTFDQNFARRELACMIIIHEYPLSMVEHAGFKRFTMALQPLFQMVSRNTLKADIFKIYDGERLKAMKVLEKIQSRVAVTTDMWTSSNQKRGFMVVTGHYVDESWKLQTIILRFIYVPCPHTAEVLCESLMETLLDWNVDRNLSTLTVDNCSSNDAVINILIGKLEPESLMSQGKLIHMRCAAHILNLIVKDGLKVIKGGIDKIRESVAYWTVTPKREAHKFTFVDRNLSC